ncbi:MAG: hypothetical protein C4320_07585 [Armatimonadota bacterium]
MILREVLHAHVPELHPESTIRDAVDRMDVYQFPALVIVDDERAVIAVITEGDICRAAATRDSIVSVAKHPALEHASRDPRTAHPDMEIGDALHLMLNSGLTVLPVVDQARLLGVCLRVDLIQAMLVDAAP